MSENWVVYMRNVNGRPATVLADLSWQERGPQADRPVWVDVWTPFRSPGENGFPESAELRTLEPLDDALAAALERAVGAAHVGSVSADGRRHWYYYARSAAVEEAVRGAFAPLRGYEPQWRTENDPAWSRYAERLCPSAAELRWSQDIQVIQALAAHGDDAEKPRPVEHRAYFDDRAAAERFVRWCRESGYTVEDGGTAPEDGQFGVSFKHVGPATIESITRMTSAADEAARRFGGEYDGWETMIVKRRPWWRFWGS